MQGKAYALRIPWQGMLAAYAICNGISVQRSSIQSANRMGNPTTNLRRPVSSEHAETWLASSMSPPDKFGYPWWASA
jgi:hypothetical protein